MLSRARDEHFEDVARARHQRSIAVAKMGKGRSFQPLILN